MGIDFGSVESSGRRSLAVTSAGTAHALRTLHRGNGKRRCQSSAEQRHQPEPPQRLFSNPCFSSRPGYAGRYRDSSTDSRRSTSANRSWIVLAGSMPSRAFASSSAIAVSRNGRFPVSSWRRFRYSVNFNSIACGRFTITTHCTGAAVHVLSSGEFTGRGPVNVNVLLTHVFGASKS